MIVTVIMIDVVIDINEAWPQLEARDPTGCCRTRTASPGPLLSPPNLDQKESLKIYQTEGPQGMFESVPQTMSEWMPDRMSRESQEICQKECQNIWQKECQVPCGGRSQKCQKENARYIPDRISETISE